MNNESKSKFLTMWDIVQTGYVCRNGAKRFPYLSGISNNFSSVMAVKTISFEGKRA